MKMQSKAITSIISNFILAVIVTGFSSPTYAQSATTSADNAVTVRYLGSQEGMILVGVNYQGVGKEKLLLSIYNEDGDVLFRNVYESGRLEKKFSVPDDHGKLTFVLSGSKEKTSRTYVIHKQSKMVEDLVVRKID
jgi:hypothetical protein